MELSRIELPRVDEICHIGYKRYKTLSIQKLASGRGTRLERVEITQLFHLTVSTDKTA